MYIVIDFYEVDVEVIGITHTKSRAYNIVKEREEETDGECACEILEYYGEIED